MSDDDPDETDGRKLYRASANTLARSQVAISRRKVILKLGEEEMKEAPTPWTLTANSWQYTTIYDANGNTVCRLDLEDWGITEENQDELEKVQAKIARLIVDKVNAS